MERVLPHRLAGLQRALALFADYG